MPVSPEDKEVIRAQVSEKTINEWVDYFGGLYTKKVISDFIYHSKLKPKKLSPEDKSRIQSQNARKYHINQDYFKTWSRNMAYILGLWFADGCIYGGKMFDITLHAKDKYILKKVAEELEYEGNLYDYVDRQASRLNFSCVVIYDDIVKLGGEERKFPYVPKEYLPDFIRGYFDGDGSIYFVKGQRINTVFCSGSREFLDSLLEILQQEAGIIGGSIHKFSLTLGKRDSIKLGEYMYRNEPEIFLKRKRDKFFYFDKEE